MTDSQSGGPVNVDASYNTFWLVDTDQLPMDAGEVSNGLVAVTQPGAAVVLTGVHTGPVAVSVEARTTPPAATRAAEWDEVVEVSLESPSGHLQVASPQGYVQGELPELTAAGPGMYWLRVHAQGRSNRINGAVEESAERYLLIAWPRDAGPMLPPSREVRSRLECRGDAFSEGGT
ncbi:hypothetical protein AB0D57_06455 [Streptomyces sp. NPDC048275]|uniref:hypothetical protein n=1 Tax=Streptomyces sp. NPDC048275 TaxID=3155629 RepID=UPI0033F4E833